MSDAGLDRQALPTRMGTRKRGSLRRAGETPWASFISVSTGSPACTKRVCGTKPTYDERELLGPVCPLGTDGKARLNSMALPEWRATFDERGNETSKSYFGTDGKLLPQQGRGCRNEADQRGEGNQASESCFGADGKPCLTRTGMPDGRPRSTNEENEKSAVHFDKRGRPLRPVAVQVREVVPKGKAAALGLHAREVMVVRYDGQLYTEEEARQRAKTPGEKLPELVVAEGTAKRYLNRSDAGTARCHTRHLVRPRCPRLPLSSENSYAYMVAGRARNR